MAEAFAAAERLRGNAKERRSIKMRIGHGYDVHALAEHRDLIIGGVKIPHELGLLGHSDAGRARPRDFGRAARRRGARGYTACCFRTTRSMRGPTTSSCSAVVAAVRRRGFHPAISTRRSLHSGRSCARTSRRCGLIASGLQCGHCVNVKATTEECLGFTGAAVFRRMQSACSFEPGGFLSSRAQTGGLSHILIVNGKGY